MWTDAHCHLADPRLYDDARAVIARSRAAGVDAWVQGGVSPEDWDRQRHLRDWIGPGFFPAFGLHPWWVAAKTDAEVDAALAQLAALMAETPFLGETGLDSGARAGGTAHLERQRRSFVRHIELAREHEKPLVLHVVREHAEAARLLAAHGPLPAGGIVHAFAGNAAAARAYVRLGLHISVNAGVARESFKKLRQALPTLPRDLLLVETDAPDGALAGQAAEPAALPAVAAALGAALGDARAESLLDASTQAIRKLLSRGTPP